MSESVEFYLGEAPRPFMSVASSFQPNVDDLIFIAKVTYRVIGRSFTVDYSNKPSKHFRCNVIVKKERNNG